MFYTVFPLAATSAPASMSAWSRHGGEPVKGWVPALVTPFSCAMGTPASVTVQVLSKPWQQLQTALPLNAQQAGQ